MEDFNLWENPVVMNEVTPLELEGFSGYYCVDTVEGLELHHCAKVGEKLQLPDQISGRWVTSIAAGALCNSDELIEVVLPHGLRHIGDYAFFQCGKIKNLQIPNGVRSIGERSFASCVGIESVYIPPSVETIGEGAFEGIEGLHISGAENSAAQRYAEAHGLSFKPSSGPAAA